MSHTPALNTQNNTQHPGQLPPASSFTPKFNTQLYFKDHPNLDPKITGKSFTRADQTFLELTNALPQDCRHPTDQAVYKFLNQTRKFVKNLEPLSCGQLDSILKTIPRVNHYAVLCQSLKIVEKEGQDLSTLALYLQDKLKGLKPAPFVQSKDLQAPKSGTSLWKIVLMGSLLGSAIATLVIPNLVQIPSQPLPKPDIPQEHTFNPRFVSHNPFRTAEPLVSHNPFRAAEPLVSHNPFNPASPDFSLPRELTTRFSDGYALSTQTIPKFSKPRTLKDDKPIAPKLNSTKETDSTGENQASIYAIAIATFIAGFSVRSLFPCSASKKSTSQQPSDKINKSSSFQPRPASPPLPSSSDSIPPDPSQNNLKRDFDSDEKRGPNTHLPQPSSSSIPIPEQPEDLTNPNVPPSWELGLGETLVYEKGKWRSVYSNPRLPPPWRLEGSNKRLIYRNERSRWVKASSPQNPIAPIPMLSDEMVQGLEEIVGKVRVYEQKLKAILESPNLEPTMVAHKGRIEDLLNEFPPITAQMNQLIINKRVEEDLGGENPVEFFSDYLNLSQILLDLNANEKQLAALKRASQ